MSHEAGVDDGPGGGRLFARGERRRREGGGAAGGRFELQGAALHCALQGVGGVTVQRGLRRWHGAEGRRQPGEAQDSERRPQRARHLRPAHRAHRVSARLRGALAQGDAGRQLYGVLRDGQRAGAAAARWLGTGGEDQGRVEVRAQRRADRHRVRELLGARRRRAGVPVGRPAAQPGAGRDEATAQDCFVVNVLVFGGTGLLGGAAVDEAVSRGHGVKVVARSKKRTDVRFERCDVTTATEDELRALCSGHDAVVYALGLDDREAHPRPALKVFLEDHVNVCTRVARAARAAGVKSFVATGATSRTSSARAPSWSSRSTTRTSRRERRSGTRCWRWLRPTSACSCSSCRTSSAHAATTCRRGRSSSRC
ncbi:MAG: hypothetical protein DI536_08870 [Archangium gephyra]|uniref:NAD(P)-binding domain-containing protein n=1 Tax=Archangium gephyra TaxID=48 RepID=A0A2W5THR4_9BACT|nr:MAG: hypothetical protein DI536_08870 [Archangium gephyra]